MLTGLLSIVLSSGGACTYGQSVFTLEEIFETAETNSVQLRPDFTAQTEAEREISVARAGRLPDINASLSLSYIGDGFTTIRNFSDYQKAPIPHFGNTLSLNITQPLYTGGAITNAIELAELKSTATRYYADMALITDMLDAANSKLDAEQQLVNARINIIYYYYKLLFTTGKI